jgi:hypothetical protein
MDMQAFAGGVAGMIFILGNLNMLIKAWRTHDVRSYSGAMLILNNIGNFVYWVYVLSLPVGPIYALHLFYTVATILMLVWWVRYCACTVSPSALFGKVAGQVASAMDRLRTHAVALPATAECKEAA